MARWADVVENEAEFAEEVRKAFDSFTHKTIATLRKDRSPRISGTEAGFVDGDVVLTTLNEARDGLAIRLWTPDGGLRTFARK